MTTAGSLSAGKQDKRVVSAHIVVDNKYCVDYLFRAYSIHTNNAGHLLRFQDACCHPGSKRDRRAILAAQVLEPEERKSGEDIILKIDNELVTLNIATGAADHTVNFLQ